MTKKIFHSILIVASAVLLASFVIILGCLYDYFGNVQEKQMQDELALASIAVENDGIDYLQNLHSDRLRLTWISSDGDVLYDTQVGTQQLENHADRPEIQGALRNGQGKSTRYSATLLEKTMYYAKELQDGTILRISISQATIGVLVLGMLQPILAVLILAFILSYLLANKLSQRIIQPLNSLDLDHPLENDTYEELAPLLHRINHQHLEISAQLRELKQKTNEFSQITTNMKEGLVLLDQKGTILSINPAAQKLFHTSAACIGQDFLLVERNHDMNRAIQNAFADGHSEIHANYNDREYQFDISRIESEHAAVGAILLAFDITEQEHAERNRREFTANVSHELKTPLQGILGSVDLIETGMAKPEDIPRFIGHIRQEATRLLALIEDIIRLSQLDERSELPREHVELLALAREIADNLYDAASSKKIKISVEGEPTVVYGTQQLLYEALYNLCDNAIKYNRPGGSVTIAVASEENNAVLTVKDTGIGIPAEHAEHVFERFYRVDKSHSKASGGTGLGLSIVKHAIQAHHGKIDLQSEPGKGTSITVVLPK